MVDSEYPLCALGCAAAIGCLWGGHRFCLAFRRMIGVEQCVKLHDCSNSKACLYSFVLDVLCQKD